MKGIIIKDFYCIAKNCRIYLLIVVIFMISSLVNENNMFFLLYPSFLIGMIPSTVIAYDERDRWNEYSKTLPYSDTVTVASKYVTSFILAVSVMAITVIANAVKMAVTSSFSGAVLFSYAVLSFSLCLIASSFNLPFMIRFGAAKGRLVTIITACIVLGVLSFCSIPKSSGGVGFDFAGFIERPITSVAILACGIVIFFLSLLVALALYKTKKE